MNVASPPKYHTFPRGSLYSTRRKLMRFCILTYRISPGYIVSQVRPPEVPQSRLDWSWCAGIQSAQMT